MKREEKAREIKRIADSLLGMVEETALYRNDLEGIGCAADAKLLDTINSKLYILSNKLQDRAKILEQN